MDLKNWFKCNTIRYFTLDDPGRDNHKNWHLGRINNYISIHDSSQCPTNSGSIGCGWNCYSYSRMDSKFTRYSGNDNGSRTRKSHAVDERSFLLLNAGHIIVI